MMNLYDLALSYKGTKHVNGGNVKNGGLDCCTLISHLLKDLYEVDIPITFNYSADWFCKKDCKEILLEYLKKYCEPVTDLNEGDIISYSWGRSKYAHLSMYIGNCRVVHCIADTGVEITDFNDPKFNNRISGYWRFKV